jgi:hypothetical protein
LWAVSHAEGDGHSPHRRSSEELITQWPRGDLS